MKDSLAVKALLTASFLIGLTTSCSRNASELPNADTEALSASIVDDDSLFQETYERHSQDWVCLMLRGLPETWEEVLADC